MPLLKLTKERIKKKHLTSAARFKYELIKVL